MMMMVMMIFPCIRRHGSGNIEILLHWSIWGGAPPQTPTQYGTTGKLQRCSFCCTVVSSSSGIFGFRIGASVLCWTYVYGRQSVRSPAAAPSVRLSVYRTVVLPPLRQSVAPYRTRTSNTRCFCGVTLHTFFQLPSPDCRLLEKKFALRQN